jgi:hypothetical protein
LGLTAVVISGGHLKNGAIDTECRFYTLNSILMTVGVLDVVQAMMLIISIAITIYCIVRKKERSIVETFMMPIRIFFSTATLFLIITVGAIVFKPECVSLILS